MQADIITRKLAEWRTQGQERKTLAIEAAGCTMQITAQECGPIACRLWEVVIARTQPADPVAVGAWAERVAKRITSLPERLKIVEIDRLRPEALLRSDPPTAVSADQVRYFEVRLDDRGGAIVRSYQASRLAGAPRTQVSIDMTHQAIGKLAADLIGD